MKTIQLLLMICMAFAMSSCKGDKAKKTPAEMGNVKSVPADLGGLYQYYHSNPTTLNQRDENTIIEYVADKDIDVIRTRNGVYIHKSTEGKGDSIKWGDPLSVHYKGYFLDGTQFDSSIDRGTPIKFKVGQMVAGWNDALPYLFKGGKATFILPSHMGYGKKGFPGYVGPDRIILFDVEVLEE